MIPQEYQKFYLKDVTFVNLMMRRIYNVLIVANPYDAFMLEDDGRVEEKIYNEYMELGLRYPPTFTQVSTTEEAYQVLRTMNIDLVICMPGNADNDAFSVAHDIKAGFLAWHYEAYGERGPVYIRLRVLLVGQHQPYTVNNKAD